MQKNNCYVVFYKGKRPFYQVKYAVSDFLIRKFTKGKYSHCEHEKNKYFCSEWCSKLLGYENPEKVTPNGLYDILNRTKK